MMDNIFVDGIVRSGGGVKIKGKIEKKQERRDLGFNCHGIFFLPQNDDRIWLFNSNFFLN